MAGELHVFAEPGARTIRMTRRFHAPRELVFDAMTKPELVRRWWGGYRSREVSVCEIDLRPGGAWRFVLRDPSGREYGFGGVFREIVRPERLTQTWRFDGDPTESVETIVFTEEDGFTVMTNTAEYPTVAARDATLATGMETGAAATLDALDALLGELASV